MAWERSRRGLSIDASLSPVLKETRCYKVLFPNYSKKHLAEDTLVSPSWEKRGGKCLFHFGQRRKTGMSGPFRAKTGNLTLKSSKKRTTRALPLVQNALYLFLPDKAQVHPSLSSLLDFQMCFVVF